MCAFNSSVDHFLAGEGGRPAALPGDAGLCGDDVRRLAPEPWLPNDGDAPRLRSSGLAALSDEAGCLHRSFEDPGDGEDLL